jgi:hypothetical protein
VVSAGATGNTISQNPIHDNSIGIQLPADGPQKGPNHLQKAPQLTNLAAAPKKGFIVLKGELHSTHGHEFRIEFFTSTRKDANGNAEGEVYLDSKLVKTNAAGDVDFTSPDLKGNEKQIFAATATDLTTNDTSEFSLPPK